MQSPRKVLNGFKKMAGEVNKKPLQILWIIVIVLFAIMCSVNLMANSIVMAMITGGMSIVLLFFALILWNRKVNYMIYIAIVSMSVMFVYFMITGGADGFSVIWILLIPIVSMQFMGMYII